jgi:hypothetical protein
VSSPEVIKRLNAAAAKDALETNAELGDLQRQWTEVNLALHEHMKMTYKGVTLQVFRTLHDGED